MFSFFKKAPRIEDQDDKKEEAQDAASQAKAASFEALNAQIMKINAQLDQVSEMRKITNERFTRVNEQVGELRGMIMDTNRSMQDVEVKTVKAGDLVEAVHPDKLMVDVRKQDAKIESLKAGIESNDSIMKSIMDQVKDMRHQIASFRGVDQVVELNDEVKKELMTIKKIEATVERHSDKIEGIFIESQKKFQEFETLTDKIKEVQKQMGSLQEVTDSFRVKAATSATKKEVEDLITRVNEFEKHMGNIIDLLTKRADDLPREVDERFKRQEKSMNDAFDRRLKKAELMNSLIDKIEKDAPRISKELNLTEKLKEVDVKKIESKEGTEMKESNEKVKEEHQGFFAKLFAKKPAKDAK